MVPLLDINSINLFEIITFFLITLNIVVFMYEFAIRMSKGECFIDSYTLIPKHLFVPGSVLGSASSPLMNLFTFIFLQAGILHTAGNMLYLWICENNMEESKERLGLSYSTFYAVVLTPIRMPSCTSTSLIPMIGASGAISGCLVHIFFCSHTLGW